MTVDAATIKSYRAQIASGNIQAAINYYNYLAANNIPYGKMAADVAANQGLYGHVADQFFDAEMLKYNPMLSQNQIDGIESNIIKGLALADIDARTSNLQNGGNGQISYEQIAGYHQSVYQNNGAPYTAWTGAGFNEFMGADSYMSGVDPATSITYQDVANLLNALLNNETRNGINARDFLGDLFKYSDFEDGPFGSIIKALYDLAPDEMTSLRDGLLGGIPLIAKAILDAFEAFSYISPIALDLNGDGIKYTALTDSHTYFDIDGDKFAEHVEWLDKNDGWLARDVNGNGKIDNATELFGETGGTSAYAKLAALDSNKDGKLTSADAAWSSLRVWQDSNGNGVSDSGELKTLASLKITALSLQQTADTDLNGHQIAGTSSFTMNGKTYSAADVLLETDQLDSWYVGDGSAASTNLDLSTLFMPQSRGYGTLPSLPYAMTQNATLKAQVTALVNMDIKTQMHTVYDQVYQILYQWEGHTPAQHLNQYSNDAVKIAVLNKLSDFADDGTCRPNMNEAFAAFESEMLVRLEVQGPLQSIFPVATYDYATDKIVLGQSIDTTLTNAKAYAPTIAAEKTVYWNEIARILVDSATELNLTTAAIMAKVDKAAGFKTYVVDYLGTSGNDTLSVHEYDTDGHVYSMGSGSDSVKAGVGNDVFLVTGSGNNYYYGGGGNDNFIINTSGGNGFYDGGGIAGNTASNTFTINSTAGNDTFAGGGGTNHFIVNSVGGNYHLYGNLTTDKVTFGGNLTSKAVTIVFDVDARWHFQANGFRIDAYASTYVFADGVTKTGQQIDALSVAAHSTAGNDRIITDYGNVTITGGKGDDYIDAYKGHSTIVINQGDGNDTIESSSTDTIQFGSGITLNALQYKTTGNLYGNQELTLLLPGGGSVFLQGMSVIDNGVSYVAGTYKFADGTSATIDTLEAKALALKATSGNDVITGFQNHDNIIAGGKGNDLLASNLRDSTSHADRFIYNLGDGHDTIVGDNDAGTTVQFGSGITFANIKVINEEDVTGWHEGYGEYPAMHITFSDGGTMDVQGANKFAFSDGTVKTVSDLITVALKSTAGSDHILGSMQNDYISGGLGNDTIEGSVGADTLDGGSGNNTLIGGSDNNMDTFIVAKSAGSTTVINNFDAVYSKDRIILEGFTQAVDLAHLKITYSNSNYTALISLEDGQTITVNSNSNIPLNFATTSFLSAKLTNGGTGNDNLVGTTTTDVIQGLAGNDTLTSGAGNDSLNGGDGADTFVITRAANAQIAITDFTLGLTGETIKLSGFTNAIDFAHLNITQDGSNAIIHLQDNQTLTLYNVNSTYLNAASFGESIINGTTGNDKLTGTSGNDLMNGLAGNDTIIGGAGADTMDGGAGTDWVSYAASGTGVNINLRLTTAQSGGDAAGDILSNIENVIGSAYNDTFIGTATANTFDGGAGIDTVSYASSDVAVIVNLLTNIHSGGHATGDSLTHIENLIGSNYNDALTGDANANTLYGGTGNDSLYGGDGNDVLLGGIGSDAIDGGAGINTASYAGYKAFVGVDLVSHSQWSSDAAYDTLTNIQNVTGSDYNDYINGDAVANSLVGGLGNDSLVGNDGNDTLDGGAGDDGLYGGNGNDLIVGGAGSDYIDGGAGTDTISYAASTAWVNVDLGGNSHWNGDAAWDSIINVENIIGSNYNDQLFGNAGANSINGGAGNDLITGGGGADTLTGGAGNDNFVFKAVSDSATATPDLITDFTQGSDHIDVRGLGLTSIAAGAATTGHLGYAYDATANETAITSTNGMKILLVGHINLVNSDFMFT